MRRWWRRRRDLADRLRPYLSLAEPGEPMVDADPISMFLFRWMIETGDPVEVVATGLDVDVVLLRSILGRSRRSLAAAEAESIQRALMDLY